METLEIGESTVNPNSKVGPEDFQLYAENLLIQLLLVILRLKVLGKGGYGKVSKVYAFNHNPLPGYVTENK